MTAEALVARLNRYLPVPVRRILRTCRALELLSWFRRRTATAEMARERRKSEQATARTRLLMQFESVGENCELGFVQQAFGANPIGLFRWSGISLPALVTALDSNLEGIGEPDNTSIYLDEFFGEYYFSDLRYGMNTHTGMFRTNYSLDEVRQLLLVRTRRLREKLIEDLQEGEKIFVFQSRGRLSADDMQGLHKAVRRFGPSSKILLVMPSRDRRHIGAVERVGPGLMLGFLDRAGFDEHRRPHWEISYQVWLSLLAAAARRCGRRVPRAATADTSALELPRSF